MYGMVFLAIGAINLIGIATILLGSKDQEVNINVINDNIENNDLVVLKKVS